MIVKTDINGHLLYAIKEGINDPDYTRIVDIVKNKPDDPEGYVYMLNADTLEWELVELPPAPEPPEEDATAEDYENALSELGVTV